MFLLQKINTHKVSYEKLTSNPTCPLAITRSNHNYFVSYHYVVTIIYKSYRQSKFNLYGPIDLLYRNPILGLNVRMQLTLPKVGKWSPPRLSKIQKTI
jgi:hypothetical protein